ncbi:MAG: hypothetical protein R3E32_09900 [Chitinophagales bacterium]
MRLTTKEYEQFLEIYPRLVFFVGKRKEMLGKKVQFEDFTQLPVEERIAIRDELFKYPKWIDEYVRLHKEELSEETIEIVLGFKNFVEGEFVLLKFLKDYTIFLQDKVAYGVLSLGDEFEDYLGRDIPIYVKAVLLPFKGKIIFDGFMQSHMVRFGRVYKASFNESYKVAKATYGIVTTLPFDNQPAYKKLSVIEQMRYFLKNADHREQFEEDIEDLLETRSEVVPVYHEEWGKIHALRFKKQLKPLGLHKAYYAILEGVLICSAVDKEKLEEELRNIVPTSKWEWVYIFRA